MRKQSLTLLIIIVFVFAAAAAPASWAAAGESNLYRMMLSKKAASFRLAEFGADNAAAGKVARQKTLAKLTGASFPKFTEAAGGAPADLTIEAAVEELEWRAEDPMDTFTGWSGALLDTLVKEAYLSMAIRYRISDGNTGKVLWEKKIANSITEKGMTFESGIGELSRRIAGNFFQSAFEKNASQK